MTINIYLSNLARYTEGRENGKWLQLPMESTKLEKVFAEIVGQNQEHIILDYNAPFKISEYENIFALNEFMEIVKDCGINETCLKVIFEVADNKEEAIKTIENETYTIVNVDDVSSGWSTMLNPYELYGMVLNKAGFNNLFDEPIPEDMIDYVDFEKIYSCLSVNDGWQDVTIDDTTFLVTLRF